MIQFTDLQSVCSDATLVEIITIKTFLSIVNIVDD